MLNRLSSTSLNKLQAIAKARNNYMIKNRKEDWPRCIEPRPNELRINNLTLLFGRRRQTLIYSQAYCQIFCCGIQGDLQEYPRSEKIAKLLSRLLMNSKLEKCQAALQELEPGTFRLPGICAKRISCTSHPRRWKHYISLTFVHILATHINPVGTSAQTVTRSSTYLLKLLPNSKKE